VVVEHRGGVVAGGTLNTVTAAAALGGPVAAVVAGQGVGGVADSVARIEGVSRVRGAERGAQGAGGGAPRIDSSSSAAPPSHPHPPTHPLPTARAHTTPFTHRPTQPTPPPRAQVLVADSPTLAHQLAEPYAELLAALVRGGGFTHVVAPAGTFGKNLLPRAGALLGCQPAADVVGVVDADTFVRPIYAGNAMATVRFRAPGLRMLTVRAAGRGGVCVCGGGARAGGAGAGG
jgi:electron transfer flavoprotein alpha subunit